MRPADQSKFPRAILLGMSLAFPAFAEDWPQWLGPRRDAIWRESGILESFPAGGPPLQWKTPIRAYGLAAPAR